MLTDTYVWMSQWSPVVLKPTKMLIKTQSHDKYELLSNISGNGYKSRRPPSSTQIRFAKDIQMIACEWAMLYQKDGKALMPSLGSAFYPWTCVMGRENRFPGCPVTSFECWGKRAHTHTPLQPLPHIHPQHEHRWSTSFLLLISFRLVFHPYIILENIYYQASGWHSTDLLNVLYQQVFARQSPSQASLESFYLQEKAIHTETISWSTCRE